MGIFNHREVFLVQFRRLMENDFNRSSEVIPCFRSALDLVSNTPSFPEGPSLAEWVFFR